MAFLCVFPLNFLSCQVSYGSDLGNRSPTFDMDLSDFIEGGKPISYEKAKKYFAQDPTQKWVVLMNDFICIRHFCHFSIILIRLLLQVGSICCRRNCGLDE